MCSPAFLSNKSHDPRPADRVFQLPLLFGRCARNATGHDFAVLGHEFFQQFGVLMVDAVNAFQIPASFFFREKAKAFPGFPFANGFFALLHATLLLSYVLIAKSRSAMVA